MIEGSGSIIEAIMVYALAQNILTHRTGNVLVPGVHQLKNQPHLTEHGSVLALWSPTNKKEKKK